MENQVKVCNASIFQNFIFKIHSKWAQPVVLQKQNVQLYRVLDRNFSL